MVNNFVDPDNLFVVFWREERSKRVTRTSCLQKESGSGDHGAHTHTGLDLVGGALEDDHAGGGSGGAVGLATTGADGGGGSGRSTGGGRGGDSSAGAGRADSDTGGELVLGDGRLGDGNDGAGDGDQDGGAKGDGALVASNGGDAVGTAASNGSDGDNGGSGADVLGGGNSLDLGDNSTDRAVGDSRSARRDGDNLGLEDGGGEGCTSSDACSWAATDTDTEGDTRCPESSTDLREEGAGLETRVEGSTDTASDVVAAVQAVTEVSGKNSLALAEVDVDVDDNAEVAGVALDEERGSVAVGEGSAVQTRAEEAVVGGAVGGSWANSGSVTTACDSSSGGWVGSIAADGDNSSAVTTSVGGGVLESTLREGRDHADEASSGEGKALDGRHFGLWIRYKGGWCLNSD